MHKHLDCSVLGSKEATVELSSSAYLHMKDFDGQGMHVIGFDIKQLHREASGSTV